jgi:hypothetical protein
MSYDELIEAELEALEYTYGGDMLVQSRRPLRVVVSIQPFTGEDSTKMYVCVDLILSAAESYPEQIPEIELCSAKGTSLIMA